MKKMFNKAVLNGTTVMGDGLTYPRIPNVYTGDNEGGYQRGDMMDANAVVEMIKELTDTGEITIEELQNLINEEIQERVEGDKDQQRYTDEKIKDLIGTSPETLDTLKEIADALGEDPDFAANVWNKIAELTTKHNEDIQELQDAITSGFENIDFTPYVKKTDIVTDTTNGLMLASDKVKLDAFEGAEQYTKAINLPDSVISNADMSSDANGITLKYTKDNLIDGGSSEVNLQIPIAKPYVNSGILSSDYAGRIGSLPYNIIHTININQRDAKYVEINWQYNTLAGSSSGYGQRISPATTSIAGVMSADDKKKLDNIIKQITLNGASTTIIDGVVDIPLATYDKSEEGRKVGGLLSNKDKSVLDDIVYIGSGIRFFRNTIYNDSSIDLVYQKAKWSSNNSPVTQDLNLNINSATTSKAGVMSAADKTKLNSLINYQAGNGIDITGDTISCTLDTSLYSIVTELPEIGLPNKIYLLPSTETEEGNVYTEYGYVDNKWEELGKYTPTVDLTPYRKALKLPNHILGTDNSDSLIKILEDGENLKLRFLYKNSISGDQFSEYGIIPLVTNTTNGLISPSNKAKLDGIEQGAQVNTIESISVNGTPLEVTDKSVNIPSYELPIATDTTLGGIKTPARAVVNGTMHIDNVLRVNSNGELELNVDFKYDKLTKKLVLELITGVGLVKTKEVDCTDFIKDGMLESANVEVNPEGYDAGTYIKLVFNTDAGKDPVYINVSDLIHEYTAGDGINIANKVISTTPISIKTENFSFEGRDYHNQYYKYSGVIICDDRYISGTKYGIAFDENYIMFDRVMTSPDGIRTACFKFSDNIINQINDIKYKENKLYISSDSTSYLGIIRAGAGTNLFIKNDIKTLIDSIPSKQDALTEAQLNNINNAITSISVNNVEQVNTNGAVDLTIPNATPSKEGLMSKEDKAKLDSIIDWSDNNAGLLPIYNGDGSDGEWIYTHWIGAGQGTDNTWRKASDIILENITSDAILNNTPIATTAKAGLMSADDKSKLANPISYYYRDLGVDTKLTDFSNNICYVGSPVLEILGNKVKFEGAKLCTLNGIPFIDCSVPKAIASLLDGLMSKEDKAKLDSQPTIKASDATGVTDDDYVVIKKSELNSILSRLSALENKA